MMIWQLYGWPDQLFLSISTIKVFKCKVFEFSSLPRHEVSDKKLKNVDEM